MPGPDPNQAHGGIFRESSPHQGIFSRYSAGPGRSVGRGWQRDRVFGFGSRIVYYRSSAGGGRRPDGGEVWDMERGDGRFRGWALAAALMPPILAARQRSTAR